MPEPFAIPVIDARPERNGTLAILGRVSVVRMASAKRRRSPTVAPALATKDCKCDVTCAVGNGTPMIPVEDGKISDACTFNNAPISAHTALHPRKPAPPVAQLALPEFTTAARTLPPLRASAARPT